MRFFLDTEFYERPGQIDLISIGIVSEDGRELYLENSQFDWVTLEGIAKYADRRIAATPCWLIDNVKPHLRGGDAVAHPREIAARIVEFVGEEKPEFWGYYADYDWVVFCWVFGRMIDLPDGFPMYCRDVKQLADMLDNPRLPKQTGTEHDALADAYHTKEMWEFLAEELELLL